MSEKDRSDPISDAPRASWIQICWCTDPNCRTPHVVLFDDDDMPIASFAVPKDWEKKLTDAIADGPEPGIKRAQHIQ